MCEAPVKRSGTYFYLVTLKCNHKQYTSRDEINVVYTRLLRKLGMEDVPDKAFELDSDRRWHFHFIVALEREPYYKGLQTPNWTTHFKMFPVEDYLQVLNYIRKIDQNKNYLDQLDTLSQVTYHPNFGFE